MRTRSLGLKLGMVLSMLAVAACGSDDSVSEDDGNNTPNLVGAEGVGIRSVAFYQSVERVLFADGVQQGSNLPLVTGRPGMLRVFHSASAEQVGKPVTARLTIEGRDPIEVTAQLSAESLQQDLATTINFDVPGDMVDVSFNYRVDLLQEGSNDNPTAHHPLEGFEAHSVDMPRNVFRVVMVPFQYNADGSGRVPDMSEASVETFRQRLMSFYPASDVEVTVRSEPVQWNTPIQPTGQGWQEVGLELFSIRNAEKAGDDVYYYGIFDPAATFAQFCGAGCLLGVTLLNNMPADVGDPSLRLALGVGFPQQAYNTCAHELAHAHGRGHAPCGPGLDPSSIDPQYPYGDGSIGVWGWDMFSNQLKDPAVHKDMMTYCEPEWISDHNFIKLGERARNVNLPKWHGSGAKHQMVTFDGAYQPTMRHLVKDDAFYGPPNVTVAIRTAAGNKVVPGRFFDLDHLPGGWLFYPQQDETVLEVKAVVGGRNISVKP